MTSRHEAPGHPTAPTSAPRRNDSRVWALLVLGLLTLAQTASGQVPDSLRAPEPVSVALLDTTEAIPDSVHTPGRAVRRALLLPGWGQLYNGQPAKVPVVVGAMVGAGVFAVYQHDQYLLYRHAFLFQQREELGVDPNEFERFRADWEATGGLSATQLRTIRDRARSNRDIAVLVTGIVYTLQALDAYVAAELDGFDVSEDLSLRVVRTSDGPALALRVGL